MKQATAARSPFSKLIQVGMMVRNLDQTIQRLSSLAIGPFYAKVLPPDAEQWFRGKPLDAKFRISAAKMGEAELSEAMAFEAGVDIAPSPDYGAVAEACGAYGRLVEDSADIPPALREALDQVRGGRTAVLDVRIGRADDDRLTL